MKKIFSLFDKNFDEAIDLLLILLDKCKKRLRDSSRYQKVKKQLRMIYQCLSWYYLLNNQPLETVKIGRESSNWYAMSTSTKINYAHALLLSDSLDNALECYRDLTSPRRFNAVEIKAAILKDFDTLEKRNISHPDFAKIREMIK